MSSSSSSGLSAEEIQTLQAIYEENKAKATPDRTRAPPYQRASAVTDESRALIRNSKCGRRRRYHGYSDGDAACGVQIESPVKIRTKASARQWSNPCKRCFPPGTDERERELEACALDLDHEGEQ